MKQDISVVQRELEFDYLRPKSGPRIEDYFEFCRQIGGRLAWPFFDIAVDRRQSRLLTKREIVKLTSVELALMSEMADRAESLSMPALGIVKMKPGLKLRVFN